MSDRYQLLYDGECPLCSREVLMPCTGEIPDAIDAVDIMAADFDSVAYGLSARAGEGRPIRHQAGRHALRWVWPACGKPIGWPALAG